MKKNSWFKKNVGMGFALLGALSSPAFAQSGTGTGGGGAAMHGIYELKLEYGVSKRQTLQIRPSGMVQATQNLGTGNEHAVVAVQGDTIAVVHVSNNVAHLRGPSGIKAEIVKMTPTGPTIVAQRQFTYSNSDREGHPAVASDGAGHFLVMYGANNIQGNGNTQTYGFVMDAQANDLTAGNYDATTNPNPEEKHIRLNADPNNNEAAPRTLFDAATNRFISGYYQNGANGAMYAMIVGIRAGKNGGLAPYDITTPQRLIASNIGRPSIVAVPGMPGIYAYAAPEGQQRPSEKGDKVALLDTTKITNNQMTVLWKQTVVQAKPNQNNIGGVDGLPGPLGGNGIYPSSPTLVAGTKPGEIQLVTFISDGMGHNRNKKGSSTSYITKLNVTTTGYTKVAEQTGVGLESSHIVAINSKVGIVGQETDSVVLYASGITGMGTGALSYVKHDPATNTFIKAAEPTAASALVTEGGYLNNMLGRNPATQGREHLNAYGDIPNLAYHVAGATFMPKVKSFIIIPHGSREHILPGTAPKVQAADGRMLPEDRDALYLSFVAAVRDADEAPPSPPPAPAPGANNGTPGTPGSDGTSAQPGTDGTPGTPGGFSGGCSYGGSAQGGALALILVGGVLLYVSRRRWA